MTATATTVTDPLAGGSAPGWERHAVGWLLLAVLLVTAWRVAVLWFGGYGLVFDEAQYWIWSKSLQGGYFSKPPGIAVAIAATTSLCGDAEGCVRLSSPLFHAATALVVGLVAGRLWGRRALLIAGLLYVTAPGVSFAAFLMTTDTILLFFWAVALYGLVRVVQGGHRAWWLVIGVAVGLGAMTKYSMLYFAIGLAVFFVMAPGARGRFYSWYLPAGAALTWLILLPNILWNIDNGFITVAHTAAHTKSAGEGAFLEDLGAALGRAGLFLGVQFAIAGPVAFAIFLRVLVLFRRVDWDDGRRMMVAFSVPILLLMAGQAVLSKAYAGWAAPALVAAILLAADWLVRRRAWVSATVAVAINLVAALGIYHYDQVVAPFAPASAPDPHARLRGWDAMGREVKALARQKDGTVVVVGIRATFTLLTYYMRPDGPPVVKWNPGNEHRDDFDVTTHLKNHPGKPYLLVMRPAGYQSTRGYFCTLSPPMPLKADKGVSLRGRLVAAWASGFRGYRDRKPCPVR